MCSRRDRNQVGSDSHPLYIGESRGKRHVGSIRESVCVCEKEGDGGGTTNDEEQAPTCSRGNLQESRGAGARAYERILLRRTEAMRKKNVSVRKDWNPPPGEEQHSACAPLCDGALQETDSPGGLACMHACTYTLVHRRRTHDCAVNATGDSLYGAEATSECPLLLVQSSSSLKSNPTGLIRRVKARDDWRKLMPSRPIRS